MRNAWLRQRLPVGQIEGVLVPFHDPLLACHSGKQWRSRAGIGDIDLGEAQLQLVMAIDRLLEDAGDKLGTQADTEDRLVHGMEAA